MSCCLQVLQRASVEYPSASSTYHPGQDVCLAAFYADKEMDCCNVHTNVALSYNQYWQHLLEQQGLAPDLEHKVYQMDAALRDRRWEQQWMFTEEGVTLSRGGPDGLLRLGEVGAKVPGFMEVVAVMATLLCQGKLLHV
jgi:hypothetical protein